MAKKNEMVAVDADRLPVIISKESKFKAKPTEQLIESVIDEIEAMLVQRTKEAREDMLADAYPAGMHGALALLAGLLVYGLVGRSRFAVV